MSLHNAAKHLAAHGRGEDTVLIHMTPEEVGGLQAAALAHGGSLTINPHTGLAEAGFLQAILPTLLGAGLSMIPGVGPLMAAGLVGGGTALATGDLKKGLMAGLGAYGGAGIYGAMNPAAVATQGASTAAASSAAAAPTSVVPNAAALAPIPAAAPIAPVSGTLGSGTYGLGGIPDAAQSVMVNPSSAAFSPSSLKSSFAPNLVGEGVGTNYFGNASVTPYGSSQVTLPKTDLGLKPSFTPTAKSFEDALLSRNGAMVAGSVLGGLQEDPKATTPADVGMIRPYKFDRTKNAEAFQDVAGGPLSSRERNYFTDQYTALDPYKAPGPEYKTMAAGGPVEQMSNNAAMGANTMYPMANMASSSFATPYQAPLSTNMLAPSGDAAVGINAEPNMQGTRFAAGGITGSGNLDLSIPLDIGGGGGYGGYGGGGRSYPFTNSGGGSYPFTNSGFTGQNNAAGGGYANPFGSSAGAGAPPSGPGMNLDPQGIFSDTFESKNVGVQNMPAAISQLFGVLGGKDQGSTLGSNAMAQGGSQQRQFAAGGITGASSLGSYSDGGRMLKGPGDGMSDNIPAVIGKKQPARLADGEFVFPADVVSHLGNGSTDAGAKQLYAMMDRIRAARTGTKKQGKQINPRKYMSA